MTSVEELCEGLNELGIKHRNYGYESHVWWKDKNGIEWHAECMPSSKRSHVIIDAVITPEQAVVATVGGTCKQEEQGWSTEGDHARVWLTCGHDCMVPTVADLPNFCPECGAKVVD